MNSFYRIVLIKMQLSEQGQHQWTCKTAQGKAHDASTLFKELQTTE